MPESAAGRLAGGGGERAGGLPAVDTRAKGQAADLSASGTRTGSRAAGLPAAGTPTGGRHP